MTYPRLVLRNLLRHPLRTLFTTLSIALSIFLVCAVLTLPGALDAIIERQASNVRITLHHKAGLTYWLPFAFVNKVRGIPGAAGVNHYSWFGGIYDEPKNMFPNFALDPETVGEVLDTMIALAESGMTMLCVTHEMGFARRVATRVIFMDEGRIVEDCAPAQFFDAPANERVKRFLSQSLSR